MIDQQQRPTKFESEAADWYARLNSTVVDNGDLARFMEWRKTPEHREAYERLSAMAGAARALRDDPLLETLAQDAMDRAAGRKPTGKISTKGPWIGAGLAVTGVLALASMVIAINSGQHYSSGIGERKTVRLADGSQVILNTDSRMTVRLSSGQRRVSLSRGQAMFEVAHDTARPFVVKAGDVEVTAVGTRFDVYRKAGAVQVTLTQGKVAVRDDGRDHRSWMLAPGQQIVVGATAPSRPAKADIDASTSWLTGQITIRDTPLAQAVEEINRYSAKKVVLAADAPRDRLVNGVFPTGDVDAFAVATSDVLDLDMRSTSAGKTIELSARRPAGG